MFRLTLERVKCHKNDVKIANFLLQNLKIRQAAGVLRPQAPVHSHYIFNGYAPVCNTLELHQFV